MTDWELDSTPKGTLDITLPAQDLLKQIWYMLEAHAEPGANPADVGVSLCIPGIGDTDITVMISRYIPTEDIEEIPICLN